MSTLFLPQKGKSKNVFLFFALVLLLFGVISSFIATPANGSPVVWEDEATGDQNGRLEDEGRKRRLDKEENDYYHSHFDKSNEKKLMDVIPSPVVEENTYEGYTNRLGTENKRERKELGQDEDSLFEDEKEKDEDEEAGLPFEMVTPRRLLNFVIANGTLECANFIRTLVSRYPNSKICITKDPSQKSTECQPEIDDAYVSSVAEMKGYIKYIEPSVNSTLVFNEKLLLADILCAKFFKVQSTDGPKRLLSPCNPGKDYEASQAFQKALNSWENNGVFGNFHNDAFTKAGIYSFNRAKGCFDITMSGMGSNYAMLMDLSGDYEGIHPSLCKMYHFLLGNMYTRNHILTYSQSQFNGSSSKQPWEEKCAPANTCDALKIDYSGTFFNPQSVQYAISGNIGTGGMCREVKKEVKKTANGTIGECSGRTFVHELNPNSRLLLYIKGPSVSTSKSNEILSSELVNVIKHLNVSGIYIIVDSASSHELVNALGRGARNDTILVLSGSGGEKIDAVEDKLNRVKHPSNPIPSRHPSFTEQLLAILWRSSFSFKWRNVMELLEQGKNLYPKYTMPNDEDELYKRNTINASSSGQMLLDEPMGNIVAFPLLKRWMAENGQASATFKHDHCLSAMSNIATLREKEKEIKNTFDVKRAMHPDEFKKSDALPSEKLEQYVNMYNMFIFANKLSASEKLRTRYKLDKLVSAEEFASLTFYSKDEIDEYRSAFKTDSLSGKNATVYASERNEAYDRKKKLDKMLQNLKNITEVLDDSEGSENGDGSEVDSDESERQLIHNQIDDITNQIQIINKNFPRLENEWARLHKSTVIQELVSSGKDFLSPESLQSLPLWDQKEIDLYSKHVKEINSTSFNHNQTHSSLSEDLEQMYQHIPDISHREEQLEKDIKEEFPYAIVPSKDFETNGVFFKPEVLSSYTRQDFDTKFGLNTCQQYEQMYNKMIKEEVKVKSSSTNLLRSDHPCSGTYYRTWMTNDIIRDQNGKVLRDYCTKVINRHSSMSEASLNRQNKDMCRCMGYANPEDSFELHMAMTKKLMGVKSTPQMYFYNADKEMRSQGKPYCTLQKLTFRKKVCKNCVTPDLHIRATGKNSIPNFISKIEYEESKPEDTTEIADNDEVVLDLSMHTFEIEKKQFALGHIVINFDILDVNHFNKQETVLATGELEYNLSRHASKDLENSTKDETVTLKDALPNKSSLAFFEEKYGFVLEMQIEWISEIKEEDDLKLSSQDIADM
eukprot:Nk52_evm8s2340 gene=Nk52_evmTU8s2340